MNLFQNLFKKPRYDYSGEQPFQTSLESINVAHHKITYRGVSMLKCPFDMVNYQMIISEVKPDLLIEIGTNKGGSALYFADLLKVMGKGIVHTIDLKQEQLDTIVNNCNNIHFYEGGWQNYEISEAQGFEKILIIDDGSHTYNDVKEAFDKLNKLVAKESYYIIEDGILDQLDINKSKFNGGPVKAIKEILNEYPEFKMDEKWSNFYGQNATFNIMGYLKRSNK
ncbi:cephalosporin hydroxylase [Roseivirga ehrenbergii]|uniref:Uncharacterized protein n=1 Tax=Roseivirga ehrenbergii (strain DSM 102268 / JCM 13514 / KCTC 12282 / NCIMB 14502 / KMM 6017) TaxID=279360 RepID=A0A150X825_ROSEK|nr:CmcI family methyltransferase [Roseivirga ehrenbergii]KYG74812.1 hypothetical protein MB14_06300 [Roseivirga ehrenbergii]TCL13855.1 cephalosporin hydroxylase [Roseivirga ehrenbergii]